MSALHPVSNLPLRDNAGNSIGEILISQGKLTSGDADKICRIQSEKKVRFGEIARELGLISETDISHALARQFNFPYLTPGDGLLSDRLTAAYDPFSDQAEAVRAVRNQLGTSWINDNRRALAVVSFGAEEGASTFIANLAITFAQSNERTLLIDANMRFPQQHELFRMNNTQGLSEMMAGRRVADLLFPVSPFERLFVLPAGTIPPNPQELLRHSNFRTMHERFSKQFDVILMDVPSLDAFQDGLIAAAQCGGALAVVRRNTTRIASVKQGVKLLRRAGIPLAGYVLVDF